MRKKYFFSVILLLIGVNSFSQTYVNLVKDLNSNHGISPHYFTSSNGALFFIGNGGNYSSNLLWKSDGTTANTLPLWNKTATNPTSFNGKIIYAADNNFGSQLWVTDGTSNGTQLIKVINPMGDSNPNGFTALNGKLYFSADDGANGYQLWSTDGTAAGTQLVKIINTSGNSSCQYFTKLGNKLYFRATDGIHGMQLWSTDGTSVGTHIVKIINPNGSSEPIGFTKLNGKLIFRADNGLNGFQLWSTDGTTSGTQLLRIINPISDSYPSKFKAIGNKIYFSANDGSHGNQLWSTDGTTSGTRLVKIINPTGNSFPMGFTALNGKVYFSANDGTNGVQLWVTDGTVAGTHLFKIINPSGDSNPLYFTKLGVKLYFTAIQTSSGGTELFETDGTKNGTIKIQPSTATSTNPCYYSDEFYLYKNTLYFRAAYTFKGYELYNITNGSTSMGVQQQSTINKFNVFPNPAGSQLTITSKGQSSFLLLDLLGNVVKSFRVEGKKTISTAGLASGIYVIKNNATGEETKIVKQ